MLLAVYVLAGIWVYHSMDECGSLTWRADLEHISEYTFGVLSLRTALLRAKQELDHALALVVMAWPMLLISLVV